MFVLSSRIKMIAFFRCSRCDITPLNALKGFQNNKSPGNDGLTAVFDTFFWDQLGMIMVSYN